MSPQTMEVILWIVGIWVGICILACVLIMAATNLWEADQIMSGPMPTHEDITE